MTKNKILLTTALAFGSLSIAMADVGPSKPSFYGKIEGGVAPYTEFNDQNFDLKESVLDTGYTFGAEVGYRYNNLRFGLNLGYHQNKIPSYTKAKTGTGDDEIPELNFKMGDLKLQSAIFNAYYDLDEIDRFTPYVVLGFGIARNKVDESSVAYSSKISPTTNPFNVPSSTSSSSLDYKSDFENSLAWNAGVGGVYRVNQNISLDVNYKYRDLGRVSSSVADGVNEEETKKINETADLLKIQKERKARLSSHNIMIGVIYNF